MRTHTIYLQNLFTMFFTFTITENKTVNMKPYFDPITHTQGKRWRDKERRVM